MTEDRQVASLMEVLNPRDFTEVAVANYAERETCKWVSAVKVELLVRTLVRQRRELMQRIVGESITFHEAKQEFFCRVCRYRDPLVGGTKLHHDGCSILAIQTELAEGPRG